MGRISALVLVLVDKITGLHPHRACPRGWRRRRRRGASLSGSGTLLSSPWPKAQPWLPVALASPWWPSPTLPRPCPRPTHTQLTTTPRQRPANALASASLRSTTRRRRHTYKHARTHARTAPLPLLPGAHRRRPDCLVPCLPPPSLTVLYPASTGQPNCLVSCPYTSASAPSSLPRAPIYSPRQRLGNEAPSVILAELLEGARGETGTSTWDRRNCGH